MDNVNLTPKDIVNKTFRPKMRGFDPAEVDSFLDKVIQDYETFTKENQRLQIENDRLIAKVDELTKQVAVGNSNKVNPVSSLNNMDILKRLSNLERHVFGTQVDDNRF